MYQIYLNAQKVFRVNRKWFLLRFNKHRKCIDIFFFNKRLNFKYLTTFRKYTKKNKLYFVAKYSYKF